MEYNLSLPILGFIAIIAPMLLFVFVKVYERAKAEEFKRRLFEVTGARIGSKNDVIHALEPNILFSQDIKQAVKSDINKAEKLAKAKFAMTPNKANLEVYVGVLLTWIDIKKTIEAWNILDEFYRTNPESEISSKLFSALAMNFWQFNDLSKAIRIAEIGLKIALKVGDNERSLQLKNDLAYYYADSGKLEYESNAKQYSKEAYEEKPDVPSRKDTKGYVKIVYGENRKEVIDGMKLCLEAFASEKTDKEVYEKHLKKGMDKLLTVSS